MSTTTLPLASLVWQPQAGVLRAVRAVSLVFAGVVVLAISARVQIPFVPVPFTMQTAVVLTIGLTYGPTLGTSTVAAYLASGGVGLPVFAAGGGLAYLVTSPTAGFLWGMLAAALVMGVMARRGGDTTVLRTFASMLVGTLVIFAFGVAWLTWLIDFGTAIDAGVMPFLASEALKIVLVALTVPVVRRAVE